MNAVADPEISRIGDLRKSKKEKKLKYFESFGRKWGRGPGHPLNSPLDREEHIFFM
jgi:hypothetical protein